MLLKRVCMLNWLKKISAIDSDKQNLVKKIENVDEKIPDISKFIQAQDFHRLTKNQ